MHLAVPIFATYAVLAGSQSFFDVGSEVPNIGFRGFSDGPSSSFDFLDAHGAEDYDEDQHNETGEDSWGRGRDGSTGRNNLRRSGVFNDNDLDDNDDDDDDEEGDEGDDDEEGDEGEKDYDKAALEDIFGIDFDSLELRSQEQWSFDPPSLKDWGDLVLDETSETHDDSGHDLEDFDEQELMDILYGFKGSDTEVDASDEKDTDTENDAKRKVDASDGKDSDTENNNVAKRKRRQKQGGESEMKKRRIKRNQESAKKSHKKKTEMKESSKSWCEFLAKTLRDLGVHDASEFKKFETPPHLKLKPKGNRTKSANSVQKKMDKKERNKISAEKSRERVRLETQHYLEEMEKMLLVLEQWLEKRGVNIKLDKFVEPVKSEKNPKGRDRRNLNIRLKTEFLKEQMDKAVLILGDTLKEEIDKATLNLKGSSSSII